MGQFWIYAIAIVVISLAIVACNRYQVKRDEATFPPTGTFVTVEGIKLHYHSKGTGQPLVFLHGGVLCGNDFAQVMDLAAKLGYQAISFDRPGYGYSERPQHEQVTPQVQARLLHAAVSQLGLEKPILVAHSWSGTLALSYALAYPDDISGVVTLGAVMYKEGYPAEHGDPISALVTAPFLGAVVLHMVLKSPVATLLVKNMMKATFAPEPVPPGYLEEALALWLRPGQFLANRQDILAFPSATAEISHRYREIKQPVVIVVGNADPFGTKEQALRLKQDIPHATLMLLPEVAHMIPHHHPEQVLKAIAMIAARTEQAGIMQKL